MIAPIVSALKNSLIIVSSSVRNPKFCRVCGDSERKGLPIDGHFSTKEVPMMSMIPDSQLSEVQYRYWILI